MISEIKRLSVPPKIKITYPVYVKTASDRYFLKIKSETEAHWLEFADGAMFKTRCTGFVCCSPGEFLDVEFVIQVCHSSSEREYINRLKSFIQHFEFVKTSLNL